MKHELFLCAAVIPFAVAACGGDDRRGSGTGGGGSDASCTEVCANVQSVCGTSGTCESECPSLSAAVRNCVATATSCVAIDGCADASGEEDAGSTPVGDGGSSSTTCSNGYEIGTTSCALDPETNVESIVGCAPGPGGVPTGIEVTCSTGSDNRFCQNVPEAQMEDGYTEQSACCEPDPVTNSLSYDPERCTAY